MKRSFLTLTSLFALSVLAISFGFGQTNGQTVPSGTEVVVPDKTRIPAELRQDLDANNAHLDDPVKLEVLEDVRSPVGGGVLIPKKAKLLGKVSYVNAPKDKKAGATLAIGLLRAEWKGGFAKLNGVMTAVLAVPTEELTITRVERVYDPRARLNTELNTEGGYGRPAVSERVTKATVYSAAQPRPIVMGGRLALSPSNRHLPAGTTFYFEQREHPLSSEGTNPFESYVEAALRGEAEGQFQVGFVFYQGQSVTQNYVEAARWYSLAAAQGLAKAQTNLAVMYAQGQGVPQDYVTAYMWFSLASAADPEKSKAALKLLESMMTPAQIAEGQRRAQEWLKQHPPSH